jgi:hypothetical protein
MYFLAECGRAALSESGRNRTLSRGACVAVALVVSAATASSQAPSRAAGAAALARAGDAVVTIVAYREGSSDVTSGTGVRVADGRVITALRHLRGAARAEVFGAEGDLLSTVTTLDQADVKLDLAVLPRITAPGISVVLARHSAALAQKVSVLGPKKGTVRSVAERTVTHVEPDDNGRPLLRLGAPVAGSAAGSPVVNSRSELVAIALGSIPGRDDGDIAIDVMALRELLARPSARLAFPSRDGTIAAARTSGSDPKPSSAVPGAKASDPAARPRTAASIFPERYGNPISAGTTGVAAQGVLLPAHHESWQRSHAHRCRR